MAKISFMGAAMCVSSRLRKWVGAAWMRGVYLLIILLLVYFPIFFASILFNHERMMPIRVVSSRLKQTTTPGNAIANVVRLMEKGGSEIPTRNLQRLNIIEQTRKEASVFYFPSSDNIVSTIECRRWNGAFKQVSV